MVNITFEHETTKYHDTFEQINFKFNGRNAVLVLPNGEANGKWFLKTEYFDAFPDFQIEMLNKGYCLAYIENTNRWGLREDTDMQYRYACFLHDTAGLSKKCMTIGMSCGGMFAIKLAARYPSVVAALYLDAPVVDLLSCPFDILRSHDSDAIADSEALNALGLTMPQMLKYREHPYDMLPELIKSRIPAVVVAGDSDSIVPFEENGKWLVDMYEKADIPIKVYIKKGCDHHPHGLADNSPIAEFAEKYYI